MAAMSRRILALVVVCVSGSACLPDFGVFASDDGAPPSDGDGDTDADVDADADTDADGDAAGGGPCPFPYLMVAVEGYYGGRSRVARLSLGDEVARCADLTGRGDLDAALRAVAWVDQGGPEGAVAVATDSRLVLIDAAQDRILWSAPASYGAGWPSDVFALVSPSGDALVAFTWLSANTSDLRGLYSFDRATGEARGDYTWTGTGPGTPFQIGNAAATASPFGPSSFMSFRGNSPDYAAQEVNPFTLERTEPPYVLWPAEGNIQTIYSFYADGLFRTAWVDGGQSSGAAPGVRYLYDTTGASEQRPGGPVRCSNVACAFEHAVPDPTLNTRLLAICETEDGVASVVRFKSTDTECEVVLSEPDLGTPDELRLWRLGVALGPED